MGVYARLLDHNEMLANLPTPPTIINDLDLDLETEEGKSLLASYLSVTFDITAGGDSISPLPSCLCGYLTGEHAVGQICPIPTCKTRVVNIVDRPTDSSLWIGPPDGVKTLFHPEAWTILSDRTKWDKRFSVLEWICDPYYPEKPPKALIPQLEKYELAGLKRGINFFYDNRDAVLDWLFNSRVIKTANRQQREFLYRFVQENKHKFFSSHLPVPSSLFLVAEKTAMGTYADEKTTDVIDAIYAITSVKSVPMRLNVARKQSHAVRCISKLSSCYKNIYTKFIGGKYGLIRKQLIGSRLHMTARAVITSLSGVHDYDELHIPWSLATQLLKYHLLSKLLKKGIDGNPMTPNEALGFLMDNTLRYNADLDRLFQELIAEAPGGRIGCILQRNPSLTRLSAQFLGISKVKTDVTDNTFSVPVLILKGYNADFDGDELNLMLVLDRKMAESMSRLAPHLGARDLKSPRRLSKFMEIPSPVSATIAHWVHEFDS